MLARCAATVIFLYDTDSAASGQVIMMNRVNCVLAYVSINVKIFDTNEIQQVIISVSDMSMQTSIRQAKIIVDYNSYEMTCDRWIAEC